MFLGLLFWCGLLVYTVYGCVSNWSSNVPPDSSGQRIFWVAFGWLLLVLVCVAGIVGSYEMWIAST